MTVWTGGRLIPASLPSARVCAEDARGTRPKANWPGRLALYCWETAVLSGLSPRASRPVCFLTIRTVCTGALETAQINALLQPRKAPGPYRSWTEDRALFEKDGLLQLIGWGRSISRPPGDGIHPRRFRTRANLSCGFCDTGLRNSLLQSFPNAANLNEDERNHSANQAA
jgi:hypothetical protein